MLPYNFLMPFSPELSMSADWPDARSRRKSAEQLIDDSYFEVWWPVPALPSEMSFIHEAERIAGDPSGAYFANVSLGFFDGYVRVLGMWDEQDNADIEVELSYEELARLMESDVLRLYREVTTPAGSTRRIPGFLHLTQQYEA